MRELIILLQNKKSYVFSFELKQFPFCIHSIFSPILIGSNNWKQISYGNMVMYVVLMMFLFLYLLFYVCACINSCVQNEHDFYSKRTNNSLKVKLFFPNKFD